MEMNAELTTAITKALTNATEIEVTYRDKGKVIGFVKDWDMRDGLILNKSSVKQGESRLHSVTFDHVVEIRIEEVVYK